MDYIELLFLGILFSCFGYFIGRFIASLKYRFVYALGCSAYAFFLILFLEVNLSFPLGNTTFSDTIQLAPYWLVLIALSGRFLMVGAFLSCAKKLD